MSEHEHDRKQKAFEKALARVQAARAELEAAERELGEPEDPCAYECEEFKTWVRGGGGYLRIGGRDNGYLTEREGTPWALLDEDEARALRRVLDIYLEEAK